MAEKIIWSSRAKKELIEIFQYWNSRNKSNIFNIKLNTLIQEQLDLILEFPGLGKVTDIPNIHVKSIQKYLLYYEIENDVLYILTIRHRSKNPINLKLK